MSSGLEIELTQDEIVERLELQAPARLGMSAQAMVDLYRAGLIEEPGAVIDLLSFCSMLDLDHPLYLEP